MILTHGWARPIDKLGARPTGLWSRGTVDSLSPPDMTTGLSQAPKGIKRPRLDAPGRALWRWVPAMAGWTLACLPAAAHAQLPSDAFLNQQRAIEEEVRSALDRQMPTDQKFDIDWGAWYSFYLFIWDDGINSSRTFRRHDFRPWANISIDEGAHQLYARGKLQFEDYNHGDQYGRKENDWVGMNLDRGFYQFDLRQAVKAYEKRKLDWDFSFKIGRDYVDFGTGYALSLPLDQVLLKLEVAKFEITGLMATSVRSMDNIDTTRPNSTNTKRNFWGTQVKYKGIEKHEPFVYAFWNDDQQQERPKDWSRNYDYDSWYVGLGSKGELLTNLRYGTEWVIEGGGSELDRWPAKKADIHAWAFDNVLEYMPNWRLQPRFIGEYMFASGDADRRYSPTDVRGGNRRGSDNSFVGFGYRDTGLSFGPRLSNVHIWRAGAACKPFEKIEALRYFETGTDWFLYAKNHSDGAVSDGTADQHSGYLGWEMDYFVNWRITSDLSWTARLGTFFPGEAFSDETTRTFFLTGVTYSF